MSNEGDSPKVEIWALIIIVLIGFAGAIIYFNKVKGVSSDDLARSLSPVPTPSRQARLYTISYNFGVFSPTNIRIHIGDSVKFENQNNAPIRIISNSVGGLLELPGFDSVGDIPPSGAFTFTFIKPGTFGYHNDKNQSQAGTVIVRQ